MLCAVARVRGFASRPDAAQYLPVYPSPRCADGVVPVAAFDTGRCTVCRCAPCSCTASSSVVHRGTSGRRPTRPRLPHVALLSSSTRLRLARLRCTARHWYVHSPSVASDFLRTTCDRTVKDARSPRPPRCRFCLNLTATRPLSNATLGLRERCRTPSLRPSPPLVTAPCCVRTASSRRRATCPRLHPCAAPPVSLCHASTVEF